MKNFCLLIVTNRENFLKNIFNFYQNCNFKIVIVHNIKSEINYIPNKNIQLIYINENMAFKRISNAIKIQNNLVDALIHIKRKNELTQRPVQHSDAQLLFEWANDSLTRGSSLNSNKITW